METTISGTYFDMVARALQSASYVFAKTMPMAPHWYTLRERWTQPEPFEAVVQFIRDHGEKERYGKATYIKLQVGSYKYWTMGAPLSETILINRAKVEEPAADAYDQIAPEYDAMWSGPEAREEDRAVIDMIGYAGGSILDVGCGTGLLLEHLQRPDFYIGIDPSRRMLDGLKNKFPVASVVQAGLETFASGQTFDYVVSLFGSPSYIPGDGLRRIPRLLSPRGRYFLMFYREGYDPLTYRMAGVQAPHFHHPRNILPGKVTDFHNFFIIEGGN